MVSWGSVVLGGGIIELQGFLDLPELFVDQLQGQRTIQGLRRSSLLKEVTSQQT